MNNRQRAEEIYNRNQPAVESYRKLGMALTPIMAATVEQIEAHLNLVDQVAQETGARLDASKISFGASREEIEAVAEAKMARNRRSAGARALSRKYGKDAAERIIANKTGRHISLQN
jgi:methionyl-tRNA synthetase